MKTIQEQPYRLERNDGEVTIGTEMSINQQPKQETLEEAAAKYVETSAYMNKTFKDYIKYGAKWQAERMYNSLSELRNELYDKLPTGNVDVFELLKLIKIHLQKLDDLCGSK
jgi:hypothetical protein